MSNLSGQRWRHVVLPSDNRTSGALLVTPMKDADGFVIRCKYSKWAEINGEDVCVCNKYRRTGYHECEADEYCRDYKPMKEEKNEA